jgi:mRNA interferase RelE/StbE
VSYTLVWAQHAVDELRRLRGADPMGGKELMVEIRKLPDRPRPDDASPLGGSGYYRLRVGSWRILYRVDDAASAVHVTKVGRVPDAH